MKEQIHTCYAITSDPLHIGAGGYRLGRVDNTIVREPGTNLPKIPGSSISGVCRNYAIYGLPEAERKEAAECATRKGPDNKPARDQGNCGRCAICNTFGFASPDSDIGNRIGRVKFFDGRILAFPVRTMTGPVWISTAYLLGSRENPANEQVLVNFDLPGADQSGMGKLNLGWLYIESRKAEFSLPETVINDKTGKVINERLVLVPEWLFAELVNSNLETRTSVAIDFDTGAAKSGQLFTYEAIPRTALFSFDIVIDSHRCSDDWPPAKVATIVKNGLALFETLGAGGMNTRGFGRLKVSGLEEMTTTDASAEGGAA